MSRVFIFLLILFYPILALSQSSGIKTTVLLKGRVVNQKNLSPIETKFYLVAEDGKKIQVKSTSDGSFSIPISIGGNYKIQSDNWLCTDPISISINLGDRYAEKEVTLYFLPFEPGLTLKKIYGFEVPTKHLTTEGKEALSFLNELNKTVPKLFFSIILYINEGYFHSQTKTITEGKKKKKVTVSARQQAEEFANDITLGIKEYLNSIGMPERKYKIHFVLFNEGTTGTKAKKEKGKETKVLTQVRKTSNLEIKIDSISKTDLENSR